MQPKLNQTQPNSTSRHSERATGQQQQQQIWQKRQKRQSTSPLSCTANKAAKWPQRFVASCSTCRCHWDHPIQVRVSAFDFGFSFGTRPKPASNRRRPNSRTEPNRAELSHVRGQSGESGACKVAIKPKAKTVATSARFRSKLEPVCTGSKPFQASERALEWPEAERATKTAKINTSLFVCIISLASAIV